jgi:hypothetical protein
MKKRERRRGDVILLRDLAPREEIRGGAGKRVFGSFAEKNGAPRGTGPGKKEKKRKARVNRI